MTPSALRVLVADDDPVWRLALCRTVEAADGLELVAACADGDEALAALREHRPDAAVLDREMPGAGGVELARTARAEELAATVVVLSASPGEDADVRWLRKERAALGALGPLLRGESVV